jgi:hypothetical protein
MVGLATHTLRPTVRAAAVEIPPNQANPGAAWRAASPGAMNIVRRAGSVRAARGAEAAARRSTRVNIASDQR